MEGQELIKAVFEYDPETGVFINRFTRGPAVKGRRAGKVSVGGRYRKLMVNYEEIYEHRAAWLYVYGYLPKEIDHIDGDGCFNAIGNLREVDRSQNMYNAAPISSSGLRGVYLDKRRLTWNAKIQVHGKNIWLGSYNTAGEAYEAYLAAADKYAGNYAYHNRPQHTQGEA